MQVILVQLLFRCFLSQTTVQLLKDVYAKSLHANSVCFLSCTSSAANLDECIVLGACFVDRQNYEVTLLYDTLVCNLHTL